MFLNTVRQEDEECDIFNIMSDDGCGFIRCMICKGDNVAFISDLFVEEDKRRKHIGSTLIDHAEYKAKRMGVEFVELKVLKDSWQQKWYEKMRYKRFSNDDKFYWMVKYIGD